MLFCPFIYFFLCHITGIPTELIEDSKFVPLNSDDPIYGPPVSFG